VPKVLRVPVLTVLTVLMVLMVLSGCAGSPLSVKVGVYNSAAEARSAGAIGSGWVPEGLPGAATDLREGHMPDGRHWGVFAFQPADEPAVRALVQTEITSGTVNCDPPGRLEFWPRVLHSPVDVEKVRSTGFRLYSGGGRTYAINWGQGRAYYWRG
jgi:hypothetical protein